LIERHQLGDWGNVSSEIRHSNEIGCRDENDVISTFTLSSGKTLWIATEDLRRFTVLVLASEQQ
jgi:hypothetical protein